MSAEGDPDGVATKLPEGLSHELSEGVALMRLTLADLEGVAALEAAHGWPMGGSAVQLAATLNDEASALLGLRVGNTLTAYAAVVRLPFEAELQAMLVDDAWRGRGFARRLLAAVVAQARAWGSERLLLEVRAGNATAIALYRDAGFEDDGVRRGYYPPLPAPPSSARGSETTPPRQAGAVGGDDREDALLMSLPLVVEEAPGG